MKSYTLILIMTITLNGCRSVQEQIDIPESIQTSSKIHLPKLEVARTLLFFNKDKSLWTYNDSLFSGYGVTYNANNELIEKFGFNDGKKQNESLTWYGDGHLKQEANYHNGRLHGAFKVYSSDSTHILISALNYSTGKLHGKQRKWYPSGEIFKTLNINMGREEGLQQAFRKNGDLYANYEVIDGRTFGLKKAALCFGIEDENIQK